MTTGPAVRNAPITSSDQPHRMVANRALENGYVIGRFGSRNGCVAYQIVLATDTAKPFRIESRTLA